MLGHFRQRIGFILLLTLNQRYGIISSCPTKTGNFMFQTEIDDHIRTVRALKNIEPEINQAADILSESIRRGGKIIICGNGGSATDALHFAGELVGRYRMERRAWPVLALNTNPATLTAIANDYDFSDVFARQVEGFGQSGDVFMGISTSGNSTNIIRATTVAKAHRIFTLGLLGNDGGALGAHVDLALTVPSSETPRIQEAHIFILHYLAGCIEKKLTP